MPDSPIPAPRPPRRWLRLSLRGLMLLVLILGAVAGWAAHQIRTQRAAVAAVRASGNSLQFDYQMEPIGTANGRPVYRTEPAAPRWLRRWVGDELFQSIRQVRLGRPASPEVLAAVARFDRLESLTVSEEVDPAGLRQLLRSLPRLREVVIMAHWVNDPALAALGEVATLRDLRVQKDRTNRLPSPATDAAFARLAGLANLESLSVDSCPNLTDPAFARLLAAWPRLQRLELKHGLKDGLPLTLAALARNHPDLRELNLDGSGVTDADLRIIAGMNRLETLSLQVVPISDAGLADLRPLQQLKTLNLNGTKISDAGLRPIAALARLESIHLTGVPITDAGLADLAALANLRSLRLDRTAVTDAGMTTLARFQSLQALALPAAITDAGLLPLARVPKLKNLEVPGSGVTTKGVAALRQAAPGLKRVIHAYRPAPVPAAAATPRP